MKAEFEVGTPVVIVDDFNGMGSHVCFGNVERITKTLIVVRNEHGNESKFRVMDHKMVGYVWPYLTRAVRVDSKSVVKN